MYYKKIPCKFDTFTLGKHPGLDASVKKFARSAEVDMIGFRCQFMFAEQTYYFPE